MGWNYRALATEHTYSNGKSEIILSIHEVYYDEDGNPNGYIKEKTINGESIKSLKWSLNKMKEALKKPVLWAGERFPEEYIETSNNI